MVQPLLGITLEIYFQPILSIDEKRLIGLEALMRGRDGEGELVMPGRLFEYARKVSSIEALDTYTRYLALERFAPLFHRNPELFLFLNFESSLIDTLALDAFHFHDHAKRLKIPPQHIILEIKEDEVRDIDQLERFCSFHRELGFTIAIDDFGTGRSSFDRLGKVRPHLIKLDRSIIHGISRDFYHQEIVDAIVRLAGRVGSLVLAEGIERSEDAVVCLEKGIRYYQGFYFAVPTPAPAIEGYESLFDALGEVMKVRRLQDAQDQKSLLKEMRCSFDTLYNEMHERLVCKHTQWQGVALPKNIEAAYIINKKGLQRGDTLMRSELTGLFRPAGDGEDHALKEYFYLTIDATDGEYWTEPYLSKASGQRCVTYARRVEHESEECVICVDVPV